MTRRFLWFAAALALCAFQPGNQICAVAQESQESASSDAQGDSGESSSDAKTEASTTEAATESDSQQPASSDRAESQSTTDSDDATTSDAEPSTDGESSESQPSESQNTTPSAALSNDSSNKSSSDEARPSLPAPSKRGDANADAGSDEDREADVSASGDRDNKRPQLGGESSRNRDGDSSDRADADDSDRDDAHRGPGGHDFDARRGIRFGQGSDRGLTVNEIERNSFYFNSGVRRGDIIVSFHGQPIRNEADFGRHVLRYRGERVPVIVLRDGRRETIYVEYTQPIESGHAHDHRSMNARAYLGVIFEPQVRDAVIVRSVAPGSPAEESGLQRGDMILALDGQEVMSYGAAIRIVRAMRPGDRLDIVVERGRTEYQAEVVLAAQPSVRTMNDVELRVGERPRVVRPQGDSDFQSDGRSIDGRDDRRVIGRDRDQQGNREGGLLRRAVE